MSVPYVIEKGNKGDEKIYDLRARMLRDRIIFINGIFNTDMADSVVAQLLFLESQDDSEDIQLYINSPGGELNSMYSIFDTMGYIKPDIVTLAYGDAISAASFILAAGTKGKRFALPNASIMIHEFASGAQGKYHDLEVIFKYHQRLYSKMTSHYAEFTGHSFDKIKADMTRDFFMTPEEAVEYGLIDKVQEKRV